MDKLARGRRGSNQGQSARDDLECMSHRFRAFPVETKSEIQLLAQSLVRMLTDIIRISGID